MAKKVASWLLFGVLGWLAFGLFGFFNKMSTFADPFAANLIIQVTTFVASVLLWLVASRSKLRFSLNAFLAGLCGSAGTLLMLFALEANQLILVYPFATFAGVVFFATFVAVQRPRFSAIQGWAIFLGLVLVTGGIFLANAGAVGGLQVFFDEMAVNSRFLLLGLGIAVLWGYLSWFWFRARVVRNVDTFSALLSTTFGLAVLAAVILLVRPEAFAALAFSSQLTWPVLAGLSSAAGATLVLTAYGLTQPQSKVHSLILSLLTNGEAIPAGILALAFLGEFVPEGLAAVGAGVVGITILNYADKL